jgi:hypothetical protein
MVICDPGISRTAIAMHNRKNRSVKVGSPTDDVSLEGLQSASPKGGRTDAETSNSNADGFVLWPFQYAGFASGSSEWMVHRFGGQGDLAGGYDLLSASSLSSLSAAALSALSLLVIGWVALSDFENAPLYGRRTSEIFSVPARSLMCRYRTCFGLQCRRTEPNL